MIRDLFGSKTVQDLLDEARGETDSGVRDLITQGARRDRPGEPCGAADRLHCPLRFLMRRNTPDDSRSLWLKNGSGSPG
jgi:hypothetical protein